MPQPTKSDVHIDRPLTNVSIAYKNDLYIWDRVFPVIKVNKESDKYYIFTQGDWFRDEARVRAPGDPVALSGYTLSTSTYSCEEYAVGTKLPDRVVKNADQPPLNLRIEKAQWVTDRIYLKMERQLASEIFTTSVWGTDNTSATDWDNASSTPTTDVQTAIDTVALATGKIPNTLVLGYETWAKGLKFNADIVDIIKYTQKGVATPQLLAQIWDLDQVLIGRAIYNSAKEGQTASYSAVWGDNALVCYVAPKPGRMIASAGYTFMAQAPKIWRWRDASTKSDIIEGSVIADFVVTGSGLGYFFSNLIS